MLDMILLLICRKALKNRRRWIELADASENGIFMAIVFPRGYLRSCVSLPSIESLVERAGSIKSSA